MSNVSPEPPWGEGGAGGPAPDGPPGPRNLRPGASPGGADAAGRDLPWTRGFPEPVAQRPALKRPRGEDLRERGFGSGASPTPMGNPIVSPTLPARWPTPPSPPPARKSAMGQELWPRGPGTGGQTGAQTEWPTGRGRMGGTRRPSDGWRTGECGKPKAGGTGGWTEGLADGRRWKTNDSQIDVPGDGG